MARFVGYDVADRAWDFAMGRNADTSGSTKSCVCDGDDIRRWSFEASADADVAAWADPDEPRGGNGAGSITIMCVTSNSPSKHAASTGSVGKSL